MCAPVGFVYLDKFLELLTHSIREVWDDTCARGKGDYMQTSPHFLGLRDPRPRCPGWLPWVAALGGRPERLATSPHFTPPRPTLAARPDLAPRPRNARTRIPAPSPGRNAAKEAVLGPTDRPTDGRRPMAGQGEPCAGPGVSVPTPLHFSGWRERSLGQISLGLRYRGGADPREGNRCARLTARLGHLLNQAVPQRDQPCESGL